MPAVTVIQPTLTEEKTAKIKKKGEEYDDKNY